MQKSDEMASRLSKISMEFEQTRIMNEAIADILWEEIELAKLFLAVQIHSPEGLFILMNMLLTCINNFIDNLLNSNKTIRNREKWLYKSCGDNN